MQYPSFLGEQLSAEEQEWNDSLDRERIKAENLAGQERLAETYLELEGEDRAQSHNHRCPSCGHVLYCERPDCALPEILRCAACIGQDELRQRIERD